VHEGYKLEINPQTQPSCKGVSRKHRAEFRDERSRSMDADCSVRPFLSTGFWRSPEERVAWM